MSLRGIRGATTVTSDQPGEILEATSQLLRAIMAANPAIVPEDLASVIFTVTDELHSAYPAQAARQMGWVNVPLLCMREIPVPASIPFCIRVLLHWNTDLPQNAMQHVYLKETARLRPDLVSPENNRQ
jgi:chorismate mutase